jgi:phosphopantothenoylcysteine decarboxylase/phosphopantothenate--cysteine ligase
MTPSAEKIIHPNAMEFATGEQPIREITGKIEHVSSCGDRKTKADLMLIAPCTHNTVSKIAVGIDDTPVTTFATTAIGSEIPIIVVPAMHSSMYRHPSLRDNIKKCKKLGVRFIQPAMTEKKAKMAPVDEVTEYVIRATGKWPLKEKKILIVGGATMEAIDDVRAITNMSSGRMAMALTRAAFERGAITELWYGYGRTTSEKPPADVTVKRFTSVNDLRSLLKENRSFDITINCAAISDYKPERHHGKIPSGKKLLITLLPTPIINKKLREKTSVLIGFKLEASAKNIVDVAHQRLKEHKLDYIIANTRTAIGSNEGKIWIIDQEKNVREEEGEKQQLADKIIDVVTDAYT